MNTAWARLVGGFLSAVLLLPLPAFATLTFSSWTGVWTNNGPGGQSGTPWTSAFTNVPGASSIQITPFAGNAGNSSGATATFVLTGSVTTGASDTSLTAAITQLNALTSISGGNLTVTVAVGNNANILSGSNQFTGTPPPSIGGSTTLAASSTTSIVITFTFSRQTSWSVSTSPTRINVDLGP